MDSVTPPSWFTETVADGNAIAADATVDGVGDSACELVRCGCRDSGTQRGPMEGVVEGGGVASGAGGLDPQSRGAVG